MDVGFLCDKGTMLGDKIKETPCVYLHKLIHIQLENVSVQILVVFLIREDRSTAKALAFRGKHTTKQKLTSVH